MEDAVIKIEINVRKGARFCEGCELFDGDQACVYFGDLYKKGGDPGKDRNAGLHERAAECFEAEKRAKEPAR